MDGTPNSCSYNHYYNGSTCVHCLAGYYGNNCSKKCDKGLYGDRCNNKCTCIQEFCDHITGCVHEYSGSSEISNRGYTIPSTDHSPANYTSPLLPRTSTSLTKDIQFPLQTNIFIFSIGSVIALFLGILIIQFCIKLCIKRRKYTQQMSMKRDPVKEEETYHEINESVMGIEGNVSRNEQRHAGKYDELHTSNHLTGEPYDKIRTQAQYHDVTESLVESSCNSDSSNSNTSYLKPKTNEGHNYIDVMESSPARSGLTFQDNDANSTNHISKVSPQYLDPVHITHNDEIVLQSHDIGDNNDA